MPATLRADAVAAANPYCGCFMQKPIALPSLMRGRVASDVPFPPRGIAAWTMACPNLNRLRIPSVGRSILKNSSDGRSRCISCHHSC